MSWWAFAWLGVNNDNERQHFNTYVTKENLLKGRGLPQSNMTSIAIYLKTYKNIPEVTGMPAEWYGPSNQREQEAK